MATLDYETPPATDVRESRKGLAYGLAAYLSWGLAPAYYNLFRDVAPLQILAHRIFWSVLFLLPLLAYRRLWGDVGAALRSRKTLVTLLISTAMISTNWFTFIYSVTIHQVVQAALGYFMNPLVVVLLGVFFLKERLRPLQVVSLGLAAIAVVILTIAQGRLPVISLVLAVSFAFYGFLRKTVNAGPLVGLFIETAVLLPLAVVLIGFHFTGGPARPVRTYALLSCAGVITAVPLLWFANAAKRLRLATMGLLQYLTPTCSFLLAVVFFDEPFTRTQRVAFPMIWAALAIYSVDSFRAFVTSTRRVLADEEPVLTDL
jgi:chloramphenicol-sensitive protein RarD